MIYTRPIYFDNISKPITFSKQILNDNGINTGYIINDSCELFYNDNKVENVRYDNRGRIFYNLNIEGKSKPYSLTRIMLRAFDTEFHPYSYYSNYQVDHINPSVPLNNDIRNVEFVTRQENMKRAGETGVMIQKYNKKIINDICQMIVDGYSRQEIINKLNINGQLIDDIRSGRSHKSVSIKYIDKGFSYKKFDREKVYKSVEEICKLINLGYRNIDIANKLNVPYCFVSDVKFGRVYRNISSKYLKF